jgi:RNA polymerase sigma-70 factor (ECF subfamily)
MSLAATLALNNPGVRAQGARFQADYGRRYSTGRGTPALNPSANPPPEREGGARRQASAERRPEAPELDWPALVRRCLDGDTAAWTELVVAQQRRVYGLCYRFTASSHDAEDLTQDVFIKLYANLRSFDPVRGSFHTWITTLTRNLLVDHFRRTRQQRATDSIDAGWDQGNDAPRAEPLVDQRTTPHQHAVQNQLERMVQNALAKVSPELREAVILRDLQDMDYKEIAEVLAIPQGTVKSRISRGRAELARLLERTKGQVM